MTIQRYDVRDAGDTPNPCGRYMLADDVEDAVEALQAKLAEALKYGATIEGAIAASFVTRPCTKHNHYWTTSSGACMACRATDAEAKVQVREATMRLIRTKLQNDLGNGIMPDEEDVINECVAMIDFQCCEPGKDEPTPIGKCDKCGRLVYHTGGFCGGCHPERV